MRERKDAQVAVMEDLWVAASSTTEIEEAPESNGGMKQIMFYVDCWLLIDHV